MRETVLDVLLNLKEVVIGKQFTERLLETQIGYLQVRGPGIVRASDIQLPPNLQCIDPNQYIATLAENGSLNMVFTIDEGKNFVHIKHQTNFLNLNTIKNQANSLGENFLSIDAIFTPIKKVNYVIESYGAEAIHKSNQVIILEVWTNGSISPQNAVSQTLNYLRILFTQLGQLKILQSIFTTSILSKNQNFRQIFKKIDNNLDIIEFKPFEQNVFKISLKETINEQFTPEFTKITKNLETTKLSETNNQEIYMKPILELGLPYRIIKAFYKEKIFTIDQILKLNFKEFKEIEGLNEEAVMLLKERLKFNNIQF